jgi:hypothetical protein
LRVAYVDAVERAFSGKPRPDFEALIDAFSKATTFHIGTYEWLYRVGLTADVAVVPAAGAVGAVGAVDDVVVPAAAVPVVSDNVPEYMKAGASGKVFVGTIGHDMGGKGRVHKGISDLSKPLSRHALKVVHHPNGWVPVQSPRQSFEWQPLKPGLSDQVTGFDVWVGDISAQVHFLTKQPEGKLAFIDFSEEPFGSHMEPTNRDTLYLHVPFRDLANVGVAALHMFVTVPFMDMALAQGRKVLVNCKQGCNRWKYTPPPALHPLCYCT